MTSLRHRAREAMKVRVRRIWLQLLHYLVSGCVISMFKFIFINQSTLFWSGEYALEKSHCTLAFKVQWCDCTWFFRHTAKNLVAYAINWSLTLSPGTAEILGTELKILASQDTWMHSFRTLTASNSHITCSRKAFWEGCWHPSTLNRVPGIQGSYPFLETNFQDFSRTFPGLRLISQGL